MIAVESLLYNIDQKLNKVAALEHQIIPVENKVLALNEAQLKLVKTKVDGNNPLGLGLDAFKKRYEDIEILIERAIDHPLDITLTDPNLNLWISDLTLLDPDYMFYIDAYLIADKRTCKNKIIYINRDLTRHSDTVTLLSNSNYIPSFEYEETFCTISGMKLETFTDGTFEFKKVYVSYLRYPVEIDFPGYIKFDGSASVRADCELQAYLEDELVSLAVEELAMDTENVPAVQFSQARIKSDD